MLPDLHIGFSRGRSGVLVFPSLSEFSTVCCDPHSQRLYSLLDSEFHFLFPSSSVTVMQNIAQPLNLFHFQNQPSFIYQKSNFSARLTSQLFSFQYPRTVSIWWCYSPNFSVFFLPQLTTKHHLTVYLSQNNVPV